MLTPVAVVDQALRTAGIPIVGVSIGTLTDRATWKIAFDASATPAQQATANALLLTVPIDAPAQTVVDQKSAQSEVDTLSIMLKALILALVDQLNVLRGDITTLGINRPAITPTAAIAAIKAKAGTPI